VTSLIVIRIILLILMKKEPHKIFYLSLVVYVRFGLQGKF